MEKDWKGKQYISVYNHDKDCYDKYEIVPNGFKNVETAEIVESPFTERNLNDMRIQTEMMKTALGEKDN